MVKTTIKNCSNRAFSDYSAYVGKIIEVQELRQEIVDGNDAFVFIGTIEGTDISVQCLKEDCLFPQETWDMLQKMCRVRYNARYSFELGRNYEINPNPTKEELDKELYACIQFMLHPNCTASTCHNYWKENLEAIGWKNGAVFSRIKRIDPKLIPFSALTNADRNLEIALFQALKGMNI